MTSNSFDNHELIFLGTGGGRIHCVSQHRHTGGFIYTFNGTQAHIDPGPGAIVYLNEMKIDRLKTKWIVVTHSHTDHCGDAPVIIESVHKSLKIPAGILISTGEYIDILSDYYKDILKEVVVMSSGKTVQLTENTNITGTKTVHGKIQGFGLIFEQTHPENRNKRYRLACTSDTEIYPDYSEVYKGVDVLIANVLRPDSKHCDRHTAVDEIIPELKKIRPKAFIMTHFGAYMDSRYSNGDLVPSQVEKIQNAVGDDVKVIGAKDGMRINLNKFLL
ncbi:MAG: MBL fold metallo-hydrolase [Promethearchaeota archaeon]